MKRPVLQHCWPHQSDPAINVGHAVVLFDGSAATRYQQWVINLTLGGRCIWRSGQQEFDLRARDLLIVRPATPVDWRVPLLEETSSTTAEAYWETIWTMFHPSPRTQEWLCAQEFAGDVALLQLDDKLFRQMRQEFADMYRLFTQSLLHRDEWTLLALDRLVLALYTDTEGRRARLDPRIRSAMRCMHECYAEPLNVQAVARAAHLSASHLSSLFASQVGIPPMQYLERIRMERAAGLLHFTSNSINEIATATGYPDADYFSHRFRRYSGQSPREFRRARPVL